MDDEQSRLPPSASPASKPARRKFKFWRWFWISFLVVSLGYAWHCFYVPINHIAWAEDYASAQQQAARSGKPVILFFTAKWCVPRRIMKRNVWADELVEAKVSAGFVVVAIDVDHPSAKAASSRYHVGSTPTTIITDPQGTVLQRAEGGIGKAEFLAMLGKLNPPAAPEGGAGK